MKKNKFNIEDRVIYDSHKNYSFVVIDFSYGMYKIQEANVYANLIYDVHEHEINIDLKYYRDLRIDDILGSTF